MASSYFRDTRVILVPGVQPNAVSIIWAGDLNGDGFSDLLITGGSYFPSGDVPQPGRVLFGDRDGKYTLAPSSVSPSDALLTVHPREIVAADFNGDGRLDIFIASHGYDVAPFNGEQNQLYLSAPDGKWINATGSLPQIKDFTHSATVGDVNGDGTIDIFVGNLPGVGGTSPYLLLNDGKGQFVLDRSLLPTNSGQPLDPTTRRYTASLLTDLDGDGRPDLVLGADGTTDGSSVILWNDTGFAKGEKSIIPTGRFLDSNRVVLDIETVDVDGDGLKDLIVLSSQSQPFYDGWAIDIYKNDGKRGFLNVTSSHLTLTQSGGGIVGKATGADWISDLQVADVNQDGTLDFLISTHIGRTPADAPFILLADGKGNYKTVTRADISEGDGLLYGATPILSAAGVSFLAAFPFQGNIAAFIAEATTRLPSLANPAYNQVLATWPADAANGVPVTATIRLAFTGALAPGPGNIILSKADGSVVETFTVTSPRVTLSGQLLTIDPTRPLAAGTGYTLSIASGALTVGGTSFAGLTGYDFTTRAVSTASLFQLLVADNGTATVSGSGTVFGTRGVLQDVTVLDAPGRVTFDPSFNAGGDRVRLAGNAADYSVVRSGSTAVLSDGDSEIALPVGAGGLDVHFADGVRTLVFDATAGVVRLGTQTIGATTAAVTAPAASASVSGTATAAPATLIVSEGGSATVHGAATVFGLRTGSEAVSVAKGAVVTFDPSFNAGGDVITLSGDAATYQAMRSSSTFVLTSGSDRLTIPIGTAGTTIRFDDAERVLKFDTATNAMKLGDQVIGTTAAGVTAAGAQTAVALTATQSALGGDFRFTHAGVATPDATVTGFARGDSLALSGEAARYVFGGGGGNVTISYLRSDGTLATTTLVGVADPSVYVFDRASAEAAVGFGFISS